MQVFAFDCIVEALFHLYISQKKKEKTEKKKKESFSSGG
jgi:hypothetical protein